jgi:TetR/AcrR family transcriptional regulator, mexJK operon transcriptional repressor
VASSTGLAAREPAGESRRGRPSARRAAEISEAIRSAALQVFLTTGFDAASMDSIAVAAGVSKGTLYARYPSKEALFRSVLEAEIETVSARTGSRDHLLSSDLEVRLSQHAATLIAAMQSEEVKRFQLLIASAKMTFPDIFGLWNELSRNRYLRFLADDMAACARLPDDVAVDWACLANVFLHTISGWFSTESTFRRVSHDEAMAFSRDVVAIIMKSIPLPRTAG